MFVKWDYTCYECECPMNVTLVVNEPSLNLFFRDYGSWCYLRPFRLCHNESMYKFYGLQVKRVCLSCFYSPKRVSLADRERGIKTVKRREPRSKTHQEIYDYFSEFVEFRKRKDLDLCIVPKTKRKTVCCLQIFWSLI
jgi:hypothetical protein